MKWRKKSKGVDLTKFIEDARLDMLDQQAVMFNAFLTNQGAFTVVDQKTSVLDASGEEIHDAVEQLLIATVEPKEKE